jgi:hypothetical protein
VNTVIKDFILGKAWEAQLAMLTAGKKCWVGSVKKWLLKNQPQEVVSFLPLVRLAHASQVGITQPPLETILGQRTYIRPVQQGWGWAKSQVLWCNTHNVWLGAQMVKLVAL